jgi:ABC-type multidrug transport system permease subunit
MDGARQKLVVIGLLFLVVFATGFWLGLAGGPYGHLMMVTHKLTSVASLLFMLGVFIQANKTAGLSTAEWIIAAATGLVFVASFASGGLLSAGKTMPDFVLWMHRVSPFLIAIGTVQITIQLHRRR